MMELSHTELLEQIQQAMPVALKNFAIKKESKPGLIIIDQIRGFCEVGAGALSPTGPNHQIETMLNKTQKLAQQFDQKSLPILVFQDTHIPGKEEPPYPPHCEMGSGEEELMPQLHFLNSSSCATFIKKDCINSFVAAIDVKNHSQNSLLDWICQNQLTDLIVTGVCTDICIMDFVLILLSARNHGMTAQLKDLHVYEPACATFEIDQALCNKYNLPRTNLHPQYITHHMGLYFMASRGANLIDQIEFEF